MKNFRKWRIFCFALFLASLVLALVLAVCGQWLAAGMLLLGLLPVTVLFLLFWRAIRAQGLRSDVTISRVLGKDAKQALDYGQIGLITYNSDYQGTWQSGYLTSQNIDVVNRKLTSFLPNVKELFEGDVDTITGQYADQVYEVTHPEDSQVLFVRNITELTHLKNRLSKSSIVVGLMNLDNYDEYASYENEEILNEIDTRIRTPLITWAKENGIFIRRLRSDRYLLILDSGILASMRAENFSILQKIKDIADHIDISITLSMVFAANMSSFTEMDRALNELLELVQSRGGDQIAIRQGREPVEFIGGNSEKASQRSKVRVRIVGSAIQDLVADAGKVFILGHTNTDYDAMGAALAMSNWVNALGRQAMIVLKDVPRDGQLQQTMNSYAHTIDARHRLITQEQALDQFDPDHDLVVMVDHSTPEISSGPELLAKNPKTVIIDHHRRSEQSHASPLLSYIESQASSTCELMTELLQASNVSVPIYEMEATIMYLGILVDTGRFKSHTSERTFQAAAALRSWGANSEMAEKALQEDYGAYRQRTALIEQARVYRDRYLIDVLDTPVSRTMLSQVSDALLGFRGCQAAFTIGINENTGNTAVSARSDGTINVQKLMEKMNGGGHFSAAALEQAGTTPEQIAARLKELIDQQEEKEDNGK